MAAHFSGNKIQTPHSGLAVLSHPSWTLLPSPGGLQPHMFCSLNTWSSPFPWGTFILTGPLPGTIFPPELCLTHIFLSVGFQLKSDFPGEIFSTNQLSVPLLYHLVLFHHKICSSGQCIIIIINVVSVYISFTDSASAVGVGAGA